MHDQSTREAAGRPERPRGRLNRDPSPEAGTGT